MLTIDEKWTYKTASKWLGSIVATIPNIFEYVS